MSTWTDRRGRTRPLSEMPTGHLRSILRMLESWGVETPNRPALQAEHERRISGELARRATRIASRSGRLLPWS